MNNLNNWLVSASTPSHIVNLQRKTKYYWSLIRLLVAVWCFRLNSQHDIIRASIIFALVILEVMTSKLSSRIQAHVVILAVYLTKLWVGSQIKENRLWLVPFSMFLQVNLYMHGIPYPLLIGSTVVNFCFISSIETSFYPAFNKWENDALQTMLSSLFQGYKVLSLNLMIGLIFIHYLYMKTLENYSNTENKLKTAQTRLDEVTENYGKMLSTLNETNSTLVHSRALLNQTKVELDFASKELEALNKSSDLILSSLSHELRNPLNSVIGNIELLLLEIWNPKFREMLQVSKNCGETILALVNNLLDVAKVRGKALELSISPVKILEILEKVWKITSTNISTKKLEGALYVSTNIPSCLLLDSHRLMQILLNLLDNAVKFTKKGSVKIYVTWIREEFNECPSLKDIPLQFKHTNSLTFSYPTLPSTNYSLNRGFPIQRVSNSEGNTCFERISSDLYENTDKKVLSLARRIPTFNSTFIRDLDRACYKKFNLNETNVEEQFQEFLKKKSFNKGTKGFLQIEIIDSGCGIHPLIQQRIFQPFLKEDASLTRDIGGLGIGLFITKHLVDKMNGSILMTSEKNSGTSFSIKIPCEIFHRKCISPIYLERSLTSPRDYSESNEKVKALIVDDNPYNQTILQSYLYKMDIEGEIANNGLEALETFKNKPRGYFSLIFMDLQMPVMDGLTACKEIRSYESNQIMERNVPIIIVTGNASESEKKQCLGQDEGIRASFFFRKPFSFSECEIAVQSILNVNNKSRFRKADSIYDI